MFHAKAFYKAVFRTNLLIVQDLKWQYPYYK